MELSANTNVVRDSFVQTLLFERDNSTLRLMAKCAKCNEVIENSPHGKLAHCTKLCVSKYQFKYNYVTKIGDILFVTCLICNQKFLKTTVAAMKIHHDKCKELQTFANMRPRIQSKTIATGSYTNGVNPPMTSCSTNPNRFVLSTSNQNVGISPKTTVTIKPKSKGFKAVTINLDKYQYNLRTVKQVHNNKVVKCAQCRICKKCFGMELILHHRTQCKIIEVGQQMVDNRQRSSESVDQEPVDQEPEILISTQTVHTEIGTVQNDDASTPDRNTISPDPTSSSSSDTVDNVNSKPINSKSNSKITPKCFVCNSSNGDSFLNLYGTVSAYTARSIYDFIWKWLGGKPSVRNEKTNAAELKDEIICSDCLDTINDYDAALLTARQCKKQICDKLMKTEAHFQRIQNEENINVINDVANGGVSVDDIQHFTNVMEETVTESETDSNAHGNSSPARQTGSREDYPIQGGDIIDLCDDD